MQPKTYFKAIAFAFSCLFILKANQAFSQLTITDKRTANQLVQKIVGAGVTFSNATLVCEDTANGIFVSTTSNLGIGEGILLTTGNADETAGVAAWFASEAHFTPGDADLTALVNRATHDACKLEFDFVPTGDTVKFRYVFGSEEYKDFSCTNYNDVFAFWISGPGYAAPKNIALVPNTNIPVAINSTSGVPQSPTRLQTCNAMGPGSPFSQYYVNNLAGTTVTYDGFTTVLTAQAIVIPCQTYHLKLAIADVQDQGYDSGVFLEAGSLTSNQLSVSTANNLQAPVPYCVRGCKNGELKFERQKVTALPLTINFQIAGTAVNGTDYTTIPSSVTIPANAASVTLPIIPLTTATGTKTVKLYVYSPFSCVVPPIIVDSSTITIYDSIYAQIATPDTGVCAGVPGRIRVVGDDILNYSWSPINGLNNASVKSPLALPATPTTYLMTATLPASTCAPVRDQITVSLNTTPSIIIEPVDRSICVGTSTNFNVTATGSTLAYQWQVRNGTSYTNVVNNSTYSGAQTATLSVSNATVGLNNGIYRCIVSGACAPNDTSFAATLTVKTAPVITAQPSNLIVCENSTANIAVAATGGGLTYQWFVDFGVGYFGVSNGGVYSGAGTGTLTITNPPSSMNGYKYVCIVSGECSPAATSTLATLTVQPHTSVTAHPTDQRICPNGNTSFTATATNANAIKWQVNTGSGFTDVINGGMYSGANTIMLSIAGATASMNGYLYRCVASGSCLPDAISNSASLFISDPPAITSAPSATAICDGGNTTFTVAATGTNITYQWQVNTGSGYSNVTNGGVYSGATTNALSITGVSPSMGGYQYQCIVSGDCPPSVSSGALTLILSVNTRPLITSQPTNSNICESKNTSFTVGATGTGITYQWQVNTGSGFSNISNNGVYSNVTTPTLNITAATKDMSGYQYRCVVPGLCQPNAISDAVQLRVDTIPVVILQPRDSTVCEGSPSAFKTLATGTGSTYQWQVNTGSGFADIPNNSVYANANSANLELLSCVTAMNNYQYRCIIAGACTPNDTTNVAILRIKELPYITTQPSNAVACNGNNTSFSITASGTGISYQWQVDDGDGFVNVMNTGGYSGATNATLSLSSVNMGMSGNTYRCIVSGTCTPPDTSESAALDVTTPPVITLQPKDSTICDGGNATFNVSASGADLSYQWQVNTGSGYSYISNSSIYIGATSPVLQLNGASTSLNGYYYRCIITGSCVPQATSSDAKLTVRSLPGINAHPASTTICEGENAFFTLGATGHGVTYQWQVNDGSGFINIANDALYSGATTHVLSLSSTQTALNGYTYRCIVSGACLPSAVSNAATLTVNKLPDIIVQPSDSTICAGGNSTFSIQAVGTGLTYQWQVNSGGGFGNITNNATYSGTQTHTLAIAASVASMSGNQYRCIISGACNPNDTTIAAKLTVRTLPNITGQPADKTICEEQDAQFTVQASGTGISYQWQADEGLGFNNILDNSIYSGATTATLSITHATLAMNGYRYRCVVDGVCEPDAISNNAILTIYGLPAIVAQPAPATICIGNNTSFSVTASGQGITYQWQVDDGSGFSNISNGGAYSGVTTNTLNLNNATTALDSNLYRCIVTGLCTPPAISDSAMLFISTPPAITIPPSATPICDGGDAIFSLGATGTNLVYQWQVNTGNGFTNISNNSLYNGATTSALSITGVTSTMSGYQYQCIISGDCPLAITSGALTLVLTVYTLPSVASNPADKKICEGSSTSFTASGAGTGISYQWQVNNGAGYTNIVNGGVYSDANTATLNINSATKDMSSYKYRCVISGTCLPNAITTNATLTVDTLPEVLLQPNDTTVCEGTAASFKIQAAGTNCTYTWQVNSGTGFGSIPNSGIYSGVNSNELSISATQTSMQNYQYRCIVSGLCAPSDTSNTAVLSVDTLPIVTGQPATSTICDGGNTVFNISATGTNISYQWQENSGSGFNNIANGGRYAGTNTPTLSLTGITVSMHGYTYRCIVSGKCNPVANSNTATLGVNTLPNITTQPKDSTICDGSDASFTVVATGANTTYRWQVNAGSGYSDVMNGSVYSNAATHTLNITGANVTMNGFTYRCIVAGTCLPNDTSTHAILSINALPAIITQPRNITICEFDNAFFGVDATGAGLTYQWQVRNGNTYSDLSNTGVYSGANSDTLRITSGISAMDGFQYRCIVSGSCQPQAVSVLAMLSVKTSPVVIVQPEDSTICNGSDASFTLAVTGTNPTYQWQVNTGTGFSNISNTGPYTGATTNHLHIVGVPVTMNGYTYRCIVSGDCLPAAISNPAILVVNLPPVITQHPVSTTICETTTTSFTVQATGAGLTYQWQEDNGTGFADLSNGSTFTNVTAQTMDIINATTALHNNQYRCIVSGSCVPPAVSNPATLFIDTAPDILAEPADVAVCPRNKTSITVTAAGTNITYKWQIKNGSSYVDLVNGAVYSGVTSNTLNIVASSVMNGYVYRCYLTGTCLPDTFTKDVVLTVRPSVIPNITLKDVYACAGDTIILTGNPDNGIDYQWQLNSVNINGATQQSYPATLAGSYTLIADNGWCKETSAPVAIYFRSLPTAELRITGNPVICPDSPVVLSATSYLKGKYQWYWNNSEVENGIGVSYAAWKAGSYKTTVSDSFGCKVTTAPVELESDPGPDPEITISNRIILCTGNYAAYRWYEDTTAIDIRTACFSAKENGTYSVFVTNFKGCSKMSKPIDMNNVGDVILVTPNPATTTIYINTDERVRTTLSTLDGKILIDQTDSKILDVSGLPTGMYMIRVYDGQNRLIKSERVIKQTW